MAKVIWLGEDQGDVAGPSFTTCYGGIRFPKGEAVELTDPDMIRKAKGNLFFKVIEEKLKQEKSHGEIAKTEESKATLEASSKIEAKEDYDYRKAEKTGYTPVKKKVRKRKARDSARDIDPPF